MTHDPMDLPEHGDEPLPRASLRRRRKIARPQRGERAAAYTATSAGPLLTSILVRLAAEGVNARPRFTPQGARVELPSSFTGGRGEVLVASHEDGARVALFGTPPPWPFSWGWERRMLRRVLGRQLSRFDEVEAVS